MFKIVSYYHEVWHLSHSLPTVPCPINSGCYDIPAFSAPFLQLKESFVLCLVPSPCTTAWQLALHKHTAYHLSSLSFGSHCPLFFDVQYLQTIVSFFLFFLVCFLVTSGRKINLVFVTPSWPEADDSLGF